MRTKISYNLLYKNVFSFIKSSKILSDTVDQLSASFIVTKVVKEEFRKSCCSRQNHYIHDMLKQAQIHYVT